MSISVVYDGGGPECTDKVSYAGGAPMLGENLTTDGRAGKASIAAAVSSDLRRFRSCSLSLASRLRVA